MSVQLRRFRAFLSLIGALAIPMSPSNGASSSGSVHGTLLAPDGSPIAGARVLAAVQLPSKPGTKQAIVGGTLATVVTSSNGAFAFDNLPPGAYTICAQALTTVHLDPCHWSGTPPSVAVSAGQTITSSISLKKGSLLQVRLNDPKKLLSAPAGPNGKPHVSLSVSGPEGQYYPLFNSGIDGSGRTYTLTIPMNQDLRFNIASKSLTLTDSSNKAIDQGGYSFPFRANSTVPAAPSFVFNVTGLK